MHIRFAELLSSVAPQIRHNTIGPNLALVSNSCPRANQEQTNSVFSDKWNRYSQRHEKEKLYEFQRKWYLQLYGFADEIALASHLQQCQVVLDAGCGLGYKAAWFAQLAPNTLIIGMDFSEAVVQAAATYSEVENLYFIQGDISSTGFSNNSMQFVSCDQVIMHTEDPNRTFAELARITTPAAGQIACYFYARKALPRELLDDYFRIKCLDLSKDELWTMSEQLTQLGRRLSELEITIDVPNIPALGIKGGSMDLQRFIYWNFLKCFWNPELGIETSVVTNFDWYSPSNALRFSEDDVRHLVSDNFVTEVFFHAEDACYSGRWIKD